MQNYKAREKKNSYYFTFSFPIHFFFTQKTTTLRKTLIHYFRLAHVFKAMDSELLLNKLIINTSHDVTFIH